MSQNIKAVWKFSGIKISSLPPNRTENDPHSAAGAYIHFSFKPWLSRVVTVTAIVKTHRDSIVQPTLHGGKLWLELLNLTK